METRLRNIKDGHYCWLDKRILNLINGYYGKHSKKQRTARSIYLALAEISSDNNNHASFTCSRALISQKSAVSSSTLDRYLNDFLKIRLIKKINKKFEKRNLVNLWFLLPYTSIQHFEYTLKDDKSHYGYNKKERFHQYHGEDMNKHSREENILRELELKK